MNWQKIRQQVLERDNNECQICNTNTQVLNIHHIIPRRKEGLHSINNLISVCDDCHGLIELKPKKYSLPKRPTVISISVELRDILKRLGKKGETYDEIIYRLLEIAQGKITLDERKIQKK